MNINHAYFYNGHSMIADKRVKHIFKHYFPCPISQPFQVKILIDMHSITRKILLLTHIHRYACMYISMIWHGLNECTIQYSLSSLVSSFKSGWLVPSDKGCRTVMNNASVMVCFLSEDGSILNIRKLIHIMVNPYLMKL